MFPQDYPRVLIEAVEPQIDCGRYPIKRVVGEKVVVFADIYKEGHDKLAARVKYRREGASAWQEAPMTFWDNDRWRGEFTPDALGRWEYTVEGYAERYLSWVDEISKKNLPGAMLTSELLEGIAILRVSLDLAAGQDRQQLAELIQRMEDATRAGRQDEAIAVGMGEAVAGLMARYADRREGAVWTPSLSLVTTRPLARFAAWYEFFPRSQSSVPGQHGTLRDSIAALPRIKEMGFDVVYLPPIHPIGHAFRKGKNNSLSAAPGDVGSPWAIGNEHGGHTALEPKLGTWADWDAFAAACRGQGIEIALDYVMNCSPDHPYVMEHPDWFYHRPDGSIKYAENPPKKYQDVYPLNFGTEDREGLWREMLRIFLFWIEKGVTTFRVDNPHTKPVAFWEWVIGAVHQQHPGVIFLAEAFTKPKMMRLLAKAGFTQSYTYFTWRDSKEELTEYVTELTAGPMKEYYTGNFFANTPDILPVPLQKGGQPAFVMRAILAATLSSVYGIYSGFELCENTPIPGREEYLDSEKYEIKQRDWTVTTRNNIAPLITRLNQIRRQHPALHGYNDVLFFPVDNPAIIGYAKVTSDKSDAVICVVNLDASQGQGSLVHLPLAALGLGEDATYEAYDLLHDESYQWRGATNYVYLEPEGKMGHIFTLSRLAA